MGGARKPCDIVFLTAMSRIGLLMQVHHRLSEHPCQEGLSPHASGLLGEDSATRRAEDQDMTREIH